MPRRNGPPPLGRSLLRLLWLPPLAAIPFALFFGTLFGAGIAGYRRSYWISLYFTVSTLSATWALERFVLPRFAPPEDRPGGRGLLVIVGLHSAAGLAGALAAALALHVTIAPGFLGGPRQVATVLMFAILFLALFTGFAFALVFYRKAMERAAHEREIQLARRIQRSFLLTEFPRRPRLDVHAVNLSSREVSGDFYDVVAVGEEGVVLVIADVSGKGVPAALLSSMLQGLVRVQAGTTPSTADATRMLNALACQREATGQFATLFLGAIHETSLTLRYTNAGHNPPVLLRDGAGRRLLDAGGLLVGMLPDVEYEEGTVRLEPGDRLVLYTDGVTEAANAADEMFGEERLYEALDEMPAGLDARAIVNRVLERVNGFLDGREAGDDITVMAVRVTKANEAGEAGPAAVGPPRAIR